MPGLLKRQKRKTDRRIYKAGVYTKEIPIGDSTIAVQVLLDEKNVAFVEVIGGDTAMYPLIEPSIKKISGELSAGKSVDEYTFSESGYYTEKILLDAISKILQEHRIADTP